MNSGFLQAYFMKGLGVSLPVWNALSNVLSHPPVLMEMMIEMAVKNGFEKYGEKYSLEAYVREFNLEEQGFVIFDSICGYEDYGLETGCGEYVENMDEFWRMREGNFYHRDRLLPFQEWMSSYEEKNKEIRSQFDYPPL